MGDKRKSGSPSVIQAKNLQKTVSIAEKLDVISQFEKGEEIVDIWCNVRLAHSVCTVCDNGDRIKDGTKCLEDIKCQNSKIGSVCLCSKTTTFLSE
jgi:hypothetical protein